MLTQIQQIPSIKQIPYSKIIYDKPVDQEEQDCNIPDEYYIKKIRQIQKFDTNKKKQQYANICYQNQNTNIEDNNIQNCNTFNRTFTQCTFNNNNNNDHQELQDNKKLTYGLNNYKDIKSTLFYINTSKDNNRKYIKSRSNSINKKYFKLNQQLLVRNQQELAQCTFTPKTNNCKPPYRSFKEFTDSHDQFVQKRQAKIKKIKTQMEEIQAANCTAQPTIDKNSRRMSQLADSSMVMLNQCTVNKNKKVLCYQRLCNLPKRKQCMTTQQATFTPKILAKSKHLQRSDRIQNLLYQDAQRRKGQQTIAQNESFKRQSLNKKYIKNPISQKQIKHNNRLICKKIKNEFLQLLQIQMQDSIHNICDQISPILALTILSQIFNVQLDPNKNEQLCINILNYLIPYDNNQNYYENSSIQIHKLWDFIKAIIAGNDGYQFQSNSFTKQEIDIINQQLGYFYFKRLLKWPNRFQQHFQNQTQYKIQISQKTNKLAEIYRNKKMQKLAQFLFDTQIQTKNLQNNQQETYKQRNKIRENKTERNIKQKYNKKGQKIIKYQDLIILDSIRQKTQLQKKKILKQNQLLKQCTFKPVINQKSINNQFYKIRPNSKQSIKSSSKCQTSQINKQNILKTQADESQNKKNNKYDSIDKVKKIIKKPNKSDNKTSIPIPPKYSKKKQKQLDSSLTQCSNKQISVSNEKKGQKDKKKQNSVHVRDADKAILRCNLGRKIKNVQLAAKQRGYNNIKSNNWIKQNEQKKKIIIGQLSNGLGYSHKNKQKQFKNNIHKNIQYYQSYKQSPNIKIK